MSILLTFATGGRPRTSAASQAANLLALGHMRKHIDWHGMVWRDDTEVIPEVRGIRAPGATKGEALNVSLRIYIREHDDHPDYWITMDDDAVLSQQTVRRLTSLARAEKLGGPGLDLVGAWNDHSEPDRGYLESVDVGFGRREIVQLGDDFCVGGACVAIPRRTLEDLGPDPYSEEPRREDEYLCDRVRGLGGRVGIARDVAVSLLQDDGVWTGYRGRILAMHFGGYDPRRERA